MRKLFITGFPGFIGTRLLRELFRKDAKLEVVALVQQKFLRAAEAARAKLSEEFPTVSTRLQFVVGDITLPNLGLADSGQLTSQITQIFHLAAAYDLAIQRDKAMVINVEGTQNVVDFAGSCASLSRLDYVSTAYVSGDHKGTFSESDFEFGQKFKNYYEETKFLAEKIVREAKNVPSVIYRPGIVVGDSRTGETAKYDGPYYVLRTMQSLPNHFPFPKIGRGDVVVNLVPIDFVVDAMATISADSDAIGKTFHLTDAAPLEVTRLQSLFAAALGKKFVSYPLTPGMARTAMKIGAVRKIYKMPFQLVDYFVHDVRYDSSMTAAFLKKKEISCPNFTEYLPNLIKFFQTHNEKDLQGILI
jgi:thioester reductase-like protein